MTTLTSKNGRLSGRFPAAARPIFLAGGLALALSACSQTAKVDVVGSVPNDYRTTHPIAIDESVRTMDVPVSVHAGSVPFAVKGNITFFAQRFLDSGAATIAIVTPSGAGDESAAVWMGYQIKDVLVGAGVPAKAIDFRVYRARGEANAPIRLAFSGTAARTAGCGPWRDEVVNDPQNGNYGNFGCATQQNLAAMVANPLDLLYPRGMTPADATRRASVLQKYQKGEAYQTDYSKETGGTVAKGVGSP